MIPVFLDQNHVFEKFVTGGCYEFFELHIGISSLKRWGGRIRSVLVTGKSIVVYDEVIFFGDRSHHKRSDSILKNLLHVTNFLSNLFFLSSDHTRLSPVLIFAPDPRPSLPLSLVPVAVSLRCLSGP